jgi:hypothetical protein
MKCSAAEVMVAGVYRAPSFAGGSKGGSGPAAEMAAGHFSQLNMVPRFGQGRPGIGSIEDE